MAITNPKWRRGLDTNLSKTGVSNGNILVTKDTGRLFIDIDDARIEITDFIKSTEAKILATITPQPKFYFATDTGCFYYYNNGWKKVNESAKKITATSNSTTKAYIIGIAGTSDSEAPLYDPNIYIDSASGDLHANSYNGYTLGAASAKEISDSTSANAISSTGTSLPTERDVYHGLPTINDNHAYTSNTKLYVPTSAGTNGNILISNGSGAPVWATPYTVLSELGNGYGTCSTVYGTKDKVVTVTGYEATKGGIISMTFSENVDAGATLNINSKGAYPIYHMGSAIKDGIVLAGATAIFVFTGSYYFLIAVDTGNDSVDDYGDEDN